MVGKQKQARSNEVTESQQHQADRQQMYQSAGLRKQKLSREQ